MSAKHQYFYPCKDLTSPEERKMLVDLAHKMLPLTSEKINSVLQNEFKNSVYQEEIDDWKTRNNLSKNAAESAEQFVAKWVEYNPNWSAINKPIITKLFGDVYIDIIETVVKRYGGDGWRVMLSHDDTSQLPIHSDPKIGPQSNLNLPLYPDYAFYRPTNYHKSYDRNDIVCSVDYKVLRSPCLLNMGKLHSAGDFEQPTNEHYNGKSVSIQIMFLGKYADTMKSFQSKGWLSTTFS
tara:strand:+ start:17098 stop:17808 length:711 start_codon:yes stop_codon:yes gene_type:complete